MGLFGIMNTYRQQLQELSIGGNSIDSTDDDFEVEPEDAEAETPDDPGDNATDTAANEEPTGEETAGTDTPDNTNTAAAPEPQADQPAEANAAPETTPAGDTAGTEGGDEEGADIPDDFSLPEDGGGDEGGTDTEGEEAADNTGGEEGVEGDDGEGIQDDFSMEDGGEGGEEGTEGDGTGDTAGPGTGGDLGGTGGDTGGATDPTSEEIKKSEDEIYETLSDEQKTNRILQLKLDFQSLYQQSDSLINAVNEIPKTEDNIESIHRIINTLNDVKKYVIDYMSMVFDKTSFLDNNAIYVKFVAIFDTVRKAIDELNKNQNDS